MSDYKAPIRDIKFVMYELMGFEEHYQTMPNGEDASQDVVEAILEESAKFCENVLAPLNSVGDEQGCTWNDGVVTTPDGFKAAYEQFVEAGWPSMTHHTEYGGQGLPESLGTVLSEMTGTSNWAWCMYPGQIGRAHV